MELHAAEDYWRMERHNNSVPKLHRFQMNITFDGVNNNFNQGPEPVKRSLKNKPRWSRTAPACKSPTGFATPNLRTQLPTPAVNMQSNKFLTLTYLNQTQFSELSINTGSIHLIIFNFALQYQLLFMLQLQYHPVFINNSFTVTIKQYKYNWVSQQLVQ